MKICQVHPACGISVPPKGWGAIEQIVWEFHQNFLALGMESEIKYVNQIEPGEFDIVLCHVHNLTDVLQEKNIPYIYQLHDHHAYHYGKNSHVYETNLKAINGSIKSLMPARYLVDYMNPDKCMYFSHGVNTDIYKPGNKKRTRDLLMVANNGLAGDSTFDRKGFGFGIGLAQLLDTTITIAGPSNNQNWFSANPWVFGVKNLEIKFDQTEEELLELYQTHRIFVHPTMLEAGHPNLTMLEAAACGMPVIADWEYETDFHGAWRAPRNVFELKRGYDHIIENKKQYIKQALKTANDLSWFNRAKDLIKLFNEIKTI